MTHPSDLTVFLGVIGMFGGLALLIILPLRYLIKKFSKPPPNRKCLLCGHTGPMKTWIRHHGMPQFIALIGLLCYVIPGIIFIAWAWGKHKCPRCDTLAKNIPA